MARETFTLEDVSLENCVENLNLKPGDGLQIFTGDELWRKYGPQTLSKVRSLTLLGALLRR